LIFEEHPLEIHHVGRKEALLFIHLEMDPVTVLIELLLLLLEELFRPVSVLGRFYFDRLQDF
jgi:hypothetical protein